MALPLEMPDPAGLTYLKLRFANARRRVWWERGVARLFGLVGLLANPDFNAHIDEAVEWWLEVDADSQVVREVGFDSRGVAICCAPIGKNFGLFVDGGSVPRPLAGEVERRPIPASAFHGAWAEFVAGWSR